MPAGNAVRNRVAVSVLSAGLACTILHAEAHPAVQEPVKPQSTIKVQAPSVVVDVIVTDKKGRHVPALRAGDFTVYDDGVPQKIDSFESTFAPTPQKVQQQGRPATLEAAPNPPLAAKRESAQAPYSASNLADVHFITLVMDMGDLQSSNVRRACDSAARYVEKVVDPDDFVAVYRVDETLHLLQPFTRDKRLVVEALKALRGRAPAGPMTAQARIETQREIDDLNARLYGLEAAAGPGPGAGGLGAASGLESGFLKSEIATLRTFLWTQSTLQARAVFVALRAIAQAYAGVPGRKNVVLFSEGFIHSPDAKPQLMAVIDAANRADVAFYIVDASGLGAGYQAENSAPEQNRNQQMYEIGSLGAGLTLGNGLDKFDWAEITGADILHDDLGQIAAETGGFLIKNQNDLLPALEKVDSDLREYYTLVYRPGIENYDGSFHHIRVELAGPEYHLRYRLGYWAIAPGQQTMVTPAAAQLLAGLTEGSLKPAFAPDVNAAVLLAPNGQLGAPVNISVPTDRVKFSKDPKHDLYHSGITLLLAGLGDSGNLATAYQRFFSFDFTKKRLDQFRKMRALNITARLPVPNLEPLTLETIVQFADGTIATAEHKLLDHTEPGLNLTNVLLSNDIERSSGPSDPSDPLRGPGFQIFVPVEPRFSPSGKLTIYFGALGVSDNHATRRPELRLSMVVKEGSRTVLALPPEVAVGSPNGSDLRVLRQVDLDKIRPGEYVLEIKAEDPVTHETVSRRASFIVG